MKTCGKCGASKPEDAFTLIRSHGHTYRSGECVDCRRARDRARRKRLKVASRPALTTKTCGSCGTVRPVGEFYRDSTSRDGYRGRCKPCHNALPCRTPDGRRARRAEVAEREGRPYRPVTPADRAARELARGLAELRIDIRNLRDRIERALEARYGRMCRGCGLRKPPSAFYQGKGTFCRECVKVSSRWNYWSQPHLQRARVRAYKHANPDKVARWHSRRWQLAARYDDGTLTAAVVRGLLAKAIRCPYCGIRMTEDDKHIDHLEPLSRHHPHGVSNVVVCCGACNVRKGAMPFAAWLRELHEPHRSRALRLYRRVRGMAPEQTELRLAYAA